MPQWSCLATNQFDAGGDFILTVPIVPSLSERFYRLQVP